MSRVNALLLLVLAACSGPRQVAVQLVIPDLSGVETPLPGTEVTALPFDRDSVLTALEAKSAVGRPHTRALDSLFQAFRIPFLAFARSAWRIEQLSRLRDSLAGRLPSSGAETPGVHELQSRIRSLDDSLRQLAPELERARQQLSAARDTLWPRIEQLQGEVRRWEHSTYAGYDTIVRGMVRDRLRMGLTDTTDASGWASLTLSPGRWWIYARALDAQDPNASWSWNLPVSADTIRLTPATGRHLPRY